MTGVQTCALPIFGIGGRFDESLQEHVKDFRGMWVSAWAYVTNWFQIVAGLNYADQNGRPPLLRHLWSLAVEEQVYLGLLILVLLCARARPVALPVSLALVCAGSWIAANLVSNWSPRLEFGTDVRAGEIAIGALLAVVVDRKSTRLNSSHIPLSRMPSSA